MRFFNRVFSRAYQIYNVRGVRLKIQDYPGSHAAADIASEINGGEYDLDSIPFAPGDVVIDIGGHVGIISLYLAKKYPFLTIHAFEPFPENYENFKKNVQLNGVSNVFLSDMAITKDRRDMLMIA